jgi:Holliday junction resolvase RusA-like endonuclease
VAGAGGDAVTLFTPSSVDIAVYGRPSPQGSKMVIERAGRHIPIEDNPHLKPWRRDVIAAAHMSMQMHRDAMFPLAEPLATTIAVYIEQPPSNHDPYPTARDKGDVDKHARSVFDALAIARLIADDCLFVDLNIRKRWASPDRPAGASIRVSPLGGTTP